MKILTSYNINNIKKIFLNNIISIIVQVLFFGIIFLKFLFINSSQFSFNFTSKIIIFYSLLLILIGFFVHKVFNLKLLISTIVSYYLFLISSYFFKMTLLLNDENFEWDKYNDFYETNFLESLFLIGLSILFCKLISKIYEQLQKKGFFNTVHDRYELLKTNLNSSNIRFIFIGQTLTALIITGSQFLDRFYSNNLLPIESSSSIFSNNLIIYFLISYISYSVLSIILVIGFYNLKNNKSTFFLSLTTSIILATVFNYYIQSGITVTGMWYDYYIVSGATIFQIFVLAALFMLFYSIVNRFLPATLISIIFGFIISFANAKKFELRNEPLLLSDLSWIREFTFFFDFIDWNIVITFIIVLLIVILLLIVYRNKILSGPIFQSKLTRLMLISSVLASFISIKIIFENSENGLINPNIPVLSSVYNVYDIDWQGLNANSRFQSLSFVWFKQLTTKSMEKPDNYSKKTIDSLYEKYQKVATTINESRTDNINDQTIIYILSESLADPKRLEQVNVSQELLPNIKSIQSKTTSGLMHADGYGGGTANMEFQSLSGLPKYNLNGTISILYTDVVPKMSYVPLISNFFDENNRIVIHLANANNYSRKAIYQKFKYDKFIATEGTKDEPSFIENRSSSYSDKSSYQNILSELDESKSQFFSVMTMQNHSPWFSETPEDIQAEGDDFNDKENNDLLSYARLLTYTDKDTLEFLEKLRTFNKKITVVFYGDHLPGLYPQRIFENQPENQYLTDYFIWSNYDVERKLDYPLVNSSDFGAELLAHTNSKVSPYYALLTEVLNNASIDKKDLSEEQKIIADDLKLIQYDLMEGNNYILEHPDFFEMTK
ncbi:sulfatase-like hydrolase/transferase [Streptococcus sp. CSL10205-OR2]|uniref:sulfatase-like hydrolase/transferase n=1 Tax=Streptococcus sp. CSL10205-OR2 TaxID=2980558 RepID=UPI0021D9A5C0|nr:sulfatase-like hydrolase/transferase [Streptococcus sp. CSL10205-OR2]MCU9533750.1 sulfatase-like hydrolase/transferase [Streptococcus sp. CSL10205-OR2]